MAKINKSEKEWLTLLGAEKYHICREAGTERAFTGIYWDSKAQGMYCCTACQQPLFYSDAKYDSGCGWPSFFRVVSDDAVLFKQDKSLGMERTEVVCSACESHLGHIFEDGPTPTGQRYCINSASLDLKADDSTDK